MNKPQWFVVFRTRFTQSQTQPAIPFDSKDDAKDYARDFNKNSQDHSWNAVSAYVINSNEPLRA